MTLDSDDAEYIRLGAKAMADKIEEMEANQRARACVWVWEKAGFWVIRCYGVICLESKEHDLLCRHCGSEVVGVRNENQN